MRLPSKQKNLIRKHEGVLFWEDGSREAKLHVFYMLLKPCLHWLRDKIKLLGLTDNEIDSEFYIMSCELYNKFDRSRSSIIPYLERQLPWYIKQLFTRLERTVLIEELHIQKVEDKTKLQEEYYWKNVLFEDKWLKLFTKQQKYVINIILASDANELSQQKLANKTNIEIRQMRNILSEIKQQLEEKW